MSHIEILQQKYPIALLALRTLSKESELTNDCAMREIYIMEKSLWKINLVLTTSTAGIIKINFLIGSA